MAGGSRGAAATREEHLGWATSSHGSDFNFDFGVAYTDELVREQIMPILESVREGEAPPIIRQNATATGTDVADYLLEGFGMSAFALADVVVYLTYSTYARGIKFLMGYYPILDRAPKGRDEAVPGRSGSGATTSTTKTDESGRPRPVRVSGRWTSENAPQMNLRGRVLSEVH